MDQEKALLIWSDRETKGGKILNEYLRNTEYKLTDEAVHLLFAMNRWEVKEEIMNDL